MIILFNSNILGWNSYLHSMKKTAVVSESAKLTIFLGSVTLQKMQCKGTSVLVCFNDQSLKDCISLSFHSIPTFRGGINIKVFWKKQSLCQNYQSAPSSFAQPHCKIYSVKVGQSLYVVIIKFWMTVSHDNFIQFQNSGAELISIFSGEKNGV